ncbi:hypothetical protein CONCODRAFT_72854 [Conidiobolus coronatus NRRL 28638]|uniref:SCP domain-containing protein n=1 Tax=Conidiobolus coronatus (strain ATCC 28846 / CBS 209.66 / NRRL 28638) TaxID=796925 RepID=A0A137NXK1_CONC2|nr:hypothetical protein CONCODRAFT_72854 [Conidiobolus coronatus NRRL 28638]|eukprot:KXN67583.1 hypothetical protein CONCODRAFT_72854 [Conidiobolus coronatus NRRL 28638]
MFTLNRVAIFKILSLHQAILNNDEPAVIAKHNHKNQNENPQLQHKPHNDKFTEVNKGTQETQNDNLKPQDNPKNDKPADTNKDAQTENFQPKKESSSNEKYPGSKEDFNPKVVLDLTNELRKQHGKKPLELRMELVKDAYEHAVYMESIDKLTHDRLPQDDMRKSLESKGIKTGNLAENIGKGSLTDKNAYISWSGSKGHKENMLGDYDYMGVAISGPYTAQTFAGKA